MNKSQLIKDIALEAGLTERQADEVLTAITDKITDVLSLQQSVRLAGFGTFSVRLQSERLGRHPQTGAEIRIPAHWKPLFKPAQSLKEQIQ